MHRIIQLIKKDKERLQALDCVRKLELPECYLAAGFVRNLVWDCLHQKTEATPLNDVDVIYFDASELQADKFKEYEARLKAVMPTVNWQVRNQALMHIRNDDEPYQSTLNAMHYWPEKETAVAIRKLSDEHFECISAFGFDTLFNLQVTYNPNRAKSVFIHRIQSKNWLTQWPCLTVVT